MSSSSYELNLSLKHSTLLSNQCVCQALSPQWYTVEQLPGTQSQTKWLCLQAQCKFHWGDSKKLLALTWWPKHFYLPTQWAEASTETVQCQRHQCESFLSASLECFSPIGCHGVSGKRPKDVYRLPGNGAAISESSAGMKSLTPKKTIGQRL